MKQASLLGWLAPAKKPVEKKRTAPRWAYRFLMEFPEGIMTPSGPAPPFRKGDLVSENVMPAEVWKVLLRRGAVEPFCIGPGQAGPNGKGWSE